MNDTYDEFTNLTDTTREESEEVYGSSSVSGQQQQHLQPHHQQVQLHPQQQQVAQQVAQQQLAPDLSQAFGVKDTSDSSMLPPVVSMSKEEIIIDNGKVCPYCHKQFTSKGSLGRHLDSKKGDTTHPHDEITAMRSLTKRRVVEVPRGSRKVSKQQSLSLSSSLSSQQQQQQQKQKQHAPIEPPAPTKKRKVVKKSMARSQISVDPASGQREKSKLRRKLRDRRIKAKLLTNEWLLDQFGQQHIIEPNSNDPNGCKFAHISALYLPISQWPDTYPDNTSYDLVVNELKVRDRLDLLSILTIDFHSFEQLPVQHRIEIWRRETIRCLRPTIGLFSIFDLHELKSVMSKKEQGHFEEICAQDNLSSFVDLDDGHEQPHEEEEEEEEDESRGIEQTKDDQDLFMARLSDTPGSIIDEFTMFRE